ncbi:MAG: alpha-L-fucosidase, partial [Lachnospiraceae bacterium]|nr:alpha-L-fucosidase [Lachnospiraceae bacterium]
LADVVSKNGNLLLNIGPKGDGSIPEGDRKILEDLAAWMAVNSEAIIGAGVWRKSQEGPTQTNEGQFSDQKEQLYTSEDYRFTANNGCLYAIALKNAEDGRFVIKALADSKDQNVPEFHGIIENVEVLGFGKAVKSWDKNIEGLCVETEGITTDFPVVFKITIE